MVHDKHKIVYFIITSCNFNLSSYNILLKLNKRDVVMNISIYGTGYVGLVSGTCLAEIGHNVCCVDIDKRKIKDLHNGILPIWEPGLKELVESNVKSGRLTFTSNLEDGVNYSNVIIIAVGTPSNEDGSAKLDYVFDVARMVGKEMTSKKLIINKSTSPVGTGEEIKKIIEDELFLRNELQIGFEIGSNPEFLREGSAIKDFMSPDRIVIGIESEYGNEILTNIYKKYSDKILSMDIKSAEFTKYASNAILATKISFMNELSKIAEEYGSDIEKVKQGMALDPRIGPHFINPGCGYGGSCFPKDVKALEHMAKSRHIQTPLLTAVEHVNEHQKDILSLKAIQMTNGNIDGKTICVWGLAFKPNTDDMRYAPSINLIKTLTHYGAKINAFDPVANDEAEKVLPDSVRYFEDKYDALKDADILIICTEWCEFKEPDFGLMKNLMETPKIIDGRNIYYNKASSLKDNEWVYSAIGFKP